MMETHEYSIYKYSGNVWNRFLQLLRIRPKKIESQAITFFGPIKLAIKYESEDEG